MVRLIFVFLPWLLSAFSNTPTVYFVNIGGLDTQRFFYEENYFRDEVAMPFIRLREAIEKAGYKVGFCTDEGKNPNNRAFLKDIAAVISINEMGRGFVRNIANYPKEKMFLLATEPPVVFPAIHEKKVANYFGRIYTLFDDEVDNVQFFKYHFPQARMEMMKDIPDFSQKKFCTLINCNKDFMHPKSLYPERRKAIAFFTNATDEFDLYGGNWEGYAAWKGAPPAKWEVLKNYKFSICYENMGDQLGYITEKIFDSFIAGCVPVYLGANNVTDYVPKECFIDRRAFESDQDLYEFLRRVDRETYEGYLTAIRNFLQTPTAHLFSKEHFAEFFLNEIRKVCPL